VIAIASTLPARNNPDRIAAERNAAARGEHIQAEYRLSRKDGGETILGEATCRGSGMRGNDSHPVMEGIIVDITTARLLSGPVASRSAEGRRRAGWRAARPMEHDFNNYDYHQG